jgi:hypothetical protein
MLIRPERVIQWMNVIRQTEGDTQFRVLENFWGSQISSKGWMIDTIQDILTPKSGVAYIMGGWYGLSAQFLTDNFSQLSVVSVDIDPHAELFGMMLSKFNNTIDPNITFKTSNMETFSDYANASIIINTSTEHLTQDSFDKWKSNLPENVPIVLQGNNLFNCDDHIRCSATLKEFKTMNKLSTYIMEGQLQCNPFTRWMTIGYR